MTTSLHLKIAALIAHVALCTAIVLEAAQADAAGSRSLVPLFQPGHG